MDGEIGEISIVLQPLQPHHSKFDRLLGSDNEKIGYAMTKSELIARLAAHFPQLVAGDAELAVKMILDAMTRSLSLGQRIEIRGFGSFGLNYRPPRVGRNPKSGEKVQVPAKHVPHFKAGKELRERVDVKKQ